MINTKNFIIFGTPRSGTTFFCKTLNSEKNIWIPEFTNFEPFNPQIIPTTSTKFKTHMFDHSAVMQKLINAKEERNKEYLGIKSFVSYHADVTRLIENNQLAIFIMMRKNIWKVLGSLLVAIDNSDFVGSSKRFIPFKFENTNRERRRIFGMFDRLCRYYWWSENILSKHNNFIEQIFFEDLVNAGTVQFSGVNNFFNKEILFSANYTEDDLEKYFQNFDEFKSVILERVNSAPYHYSALPEYILKELDL
jgi:hypothetical protein